MEPNVIGFSEIDETKRALVGGKGVNLGELSRIEGIRVPGGFCVTTAAYQRVVGGNDEFGGLLHQLSLLKPDDREETFYGARHQSYQVIAFSAGQKPQRR